MALSRSDLVALRQTLGRQIPREYLALLRSMPRALATQLAARGKDAEQPLFRELATVRAENDEVREEDIWTEEGPWPDGHLVIGAELGGDRFTLDATARPPIVYQLLHEVGTLRRIGTLRTYLRAVSAWLRGKVPTIGAALSEPAPATRATVAGTPAVVRSAQEAKARASGVDTDWGDATILHRDAHHFADALRCCEHFIAAAEPNAFAHSLRVELLAALVRHEADPTWRPELAGQALGIFGDLASLHAAHIAAAQASLVAAEADEEDGDPEEAELALALARKAAG